MPVYTRRQLTLLFVLVAAAGLGIGVGHWRRAYPELAERLERLDRDADLSSSPRRGGAGRPGRRADAARPEGAGPQEPPISRASAAPDGEERVDLNRATAEELSRLPGVGPVLALRIVAERERAGPFTGVDDLRRVGGLRPAKIEGLRQLVTVATDP